VSGLPVTVTGRAKHLRKNKGHGSHFKAFLVGAREAFLSSRCFHLLFSSRNRSSYSLISIFCNQGLWYELKGFFFFFLRMADICCGVVSKSEAKTPCEQSSRAARRRRMEIRRFKFVSGVSSPETENGHKRQKLEVYSRGCENAVENSDSDGEKQVLVADTGRSENKDISVSNQSISTGSVSPSTHVAPEASREYPKFGVASVCGRRRDMEDTVAIHPSFCRRDGETATELHYFGVYDGHGCSHVRVLLFHSINQTKKKKKKI
jgi:hypothetical protein